MPEQKVPDERRKVARIVVTWNSYSNEDLDDHDGPDEGWYVDVDTPEGSVSTGPDFYGPGFPTLDEAIAAVKHWAISRRLHVNTTSFFFDVFRDGADRAGSE